LEVAGRAETLRANAVIRKPCWPAPHDEFRALREAGYPGDLFPTQPGGFKRLSAIRKLWADTLVQVKEGKS
jgi:hypothetical protein